MDAIAHARLLDDGSWAPPHLLLEHLRDVGALAEQYCAVFGNGDWGYLAGLWHDLGKYKKDFQNYIRTVSGYERDQAQDGGPGKVDHTAAGAIHAVERLGPIGRILAYLIAGHHSGLPDWYKEKAPGRALSERLAERANLADALAGLPPSGVTEAPPPTSRPCGAALPPGQAHLWIRMLFSALVDADFLDTEAYMSPQRRTAREASGRDSDLRELKAKYDDYMGEKQSSAAPSPLNKVRREILEQCLDGAVQSPGFFSLTVPTGGGKTLASLGFALSHAIAHGKRRVIIAIPYTSIIEQTVEVLRGVFGDDAVLEHHSNLDPDTETQSSKLATENWDAPIVVTTNVQLFESLFAARTSACRKLHNIVGSVIILDEAQMIPPEFLKPILSTLTGLVSLFGASVVLCTATQPALTGHIGPRAQGKDGGFEGLRNVRELMKQPDLLAVQLRRVSVVPRDLDRVTTWEEIAASLLNEPQALCIVNTRRDCRELHALLPTDTIHLSALMCGEHRSGVIRYIKNTLQRGAPLRVVSTQLVEAGVDIDFPVVFRAMAGLDSIAQAAGRCNREGRLLNGQLGRVVVFRAVRQAPPGLLRKGQDAALELLRTDPGLATALTPAAFSVYFQRFFGRVNSFDEANILDPLIASESAFEFQFRTVASRFRLIDDAAQRPVIVWFDGPRFKSADLIATLRQYGPTRKTMRRLQRFTVNIPERAWKGLIQQGAIEELHGPTGPLAIWAQALPGLYDEIFGLRLEGPEFTGDEFVC